MLRTLQRLALRITQQVLEFLKSLEAKIIQQIVTLIIDFRIDGITMLLANGNKLLRDIADFLPCFGHRLIRQLMNHIGELVRCIFMMIGNRDARSQRSIV